MKFNTYVSEILIFLLVLFFFIIPPCLFFINTTDEVFVNWNFPINQMIMAIISLFIFLFFENKKEKEKITSSILIYKILIPSTFILCILFCTVLLIKALEFYIPLGKSQSFVFPDSFVKWIYLILNFFFAAFTEEIIYRYYFCDSLIHLFKVSKKTIFILFEIFTTGVFAFGHGYAGIYAVINALVAHIILRIFYKKTGFIWAGFIAHFIYNVISLILL